MNAVTEQPTQRRFTGQRWDLVLLVINLIGAVMYVFASSHGWVIPEEPVTGEPFIWALWVFPIWGVYLLLNLTWGAFIVIDKQWRSGRVWLLTIPIWAISVVIDFAHH